MGGSASEVLSKLVGIPDTLDDVVGYCTDLTEAAETIPYSLQRRTIITVDFPGIVEGLHVDMEERMLPLTKADVAYQVRKIRDRRANPTLQEIAEVVIHAIKRKVTDADLQRLESPADLDDPKRWLQWSSLVESVASRTVKVDVLRQAVVGKVGLRPKPMKRVRFYGQAEYVFDALEVTASVPLTDLESTRRPGEDWRLNWHCFSPRRELTPLAFQHLVHFAQKASLCAFSMLCNRHTLVCLVTAVRIPPAPDPTSGHMNPFLDT
ncbi:hypothetical protein DYB28_004458 [Aphanomyces astaci]|uniref:Uncharacterized protein n=1 Tax=Aphanomyces astaci TaxID=112090 RepID=A0A9X8HG95_APHAT|nr:hypothetical protein DYB28_004458 [Aphanomyces astaci]